MNVLDSILDYTAIASFVILTNTVYARQWALTGKLNVICIAMDVQIITLGIIRLIGMRREARIAHLWSFLIVFMGFMASLIVSRSPNAVILHFAAVFAALFYTTCIENRESLVRFLRRFVSFVTVLAAISIVFWLLGSTLKTIKPDSYVEYLWDKYVLTANSYHGVYFETQRGVEFSFSDWRNDGVFVEAPMYSFILCLALGTNALLLREKAFKSIVLTITILTTTSTTGYVAICIVLFAIISTTPVKGKTLNALRLACIPIIIVSMMIAVQFVLGEKVETGSYSVRSDHLATCFKLFWDSFPLGVGFGDSQTFVNAYTYAQGTSVGTAYLLAQGGIFSVVLYICPLLYSIYRGLARKDWLFIAFQLCFAWEVFCTAIVSTAMFWLFVWITMLRWPVLVMLEQ